MARLLKMNLGGGEDLESAFMEMEALPEAPHNPLWKRVKHDPRWLTDRWIVRAAGRQLKRSPRRGGSR